ncbi:TPA: hypothetical protein N0F65_001243 [Lagenidium giganteum]|uniref:NAD-dependent epimerase/dehydratase domain-containing protein n=1 Tax=Lagenidium giganteum TaxID=4803 RepID=A0AAV2YUL3_9STRA|nr:TPA: hypothetical protein N0F65_001243 [Lagenidium giganteum]
MAPMPPFSAPTDTTLPSELAVARGQTVLVTGAAGFIGFHTCVALLERGDSVVIIDELNDYYDVKLKQSNLDYLTNNYPADRVKIYVGDLCDEQLVRRAIKENHPTSMIHLAARAGVRPSIDNPLLYVHSNVHASTVLLEACRQCGIRRFVYASSSSVYGGSKKEFFSESDVVDFPVSPYAATKKTCELLAHTYHHLYQIETLGLRFFTVYGPRGRPDMAPFKFMDRIARDLSIDQYGDGTTSRDYTYIDDIVQGVLLCHDKGKGCEVFNLGNGTPMLLKDFISTIESLVGKRATIKLLPEQPGDVPRTCADITKAQTLLGYQPSTPVAVGLAKTWAWYSEFYQNQSA